MLKMLASFLLSLSLIMFTATDQNLIDCGVLINTPYEDSISNRFFVINEVSGFRIFWFDLDHLDIFS